MPLRFFGPKDVRQHKGPISVAVEARPVEYVIRFVRRSFQDRLISVGEKIRFQDGEKITESIDFFWADAVDLSLIHI